jgi:hypothetical protein
VNDGLRRILIEDVMAYFKFSPNFLVGINGILEEPLVILPRGHPEKKVGVTAAQM